MRRTARVRRRRVGAVASGLALFSALGLGSSPARGNGRFPRAQRLLEDPNDAKHLTLAATFGLLTTSDRGKNWYHVCEANFAGDAAYSGDPILERVAGGALLVDVQSAMRRSADACTWASTLGDPAAAASDTIVDFAVDRATAMTVVAIETVLGDGGAHTFLRESVDAGVTWKVIGTPLPVSTALTVDLDPIDASHIMATGLTASEGVFLDSTDQGTTWTSVPIPGTDSNNVPFIAAIDPRDPKKVFVRTDAWVLPADGSESVANDALLYSNDGGGTWSEILRKGAKVLGFAISPDDTSILAGYGDPVEPGYSVTPEDMGVYQASMSDMQFRGVYSGNNVTCLTWTDAGTYVCTEAPASGTYEELVFFAQGQLDADGSAPSPLMRLSDVAGPPPCCAAAAVACPWPTLCAMFNACGDAGAPAAACAEAEPSPSPEAPSAKTPVDGGCAVAMPGGCGLSPAPARASFAFLTAFGIVLVRARRRLR